MLDKEWVHAFVEPSDVSHVFVTISPFVHALEPFPVQELLLTPKHALVPCFPSQAFDPEPLQVLVESSAQLFIEPASQVFAVPPPHEFVADPVQSLLAAAPLQLFASVPSHRF